MQTNTTGQAIIKRSNHNKKNLLSKPTFIEMINSDTNVLVKKDIIKANIISLYFFISIEYHKQKTSSVKIQLCMFSKKKGIFFLNLKKPALAYGQHIRSN